MTVIPKRMVKLLLGALLVSIILGSVPSSAQEQTIIEFYAETPAVSDLVLEVETTVTGKVEYTPFGWKIPPGHIVRIEIQHPPPEMAMAEVRLGYDWSGGVVSAIFAGHGVRRNKYKVFQEMLYPNETQKRIFPDMYARGYEFSIQTVFSQSAGDNYLLLQSLSLIWQPEKKEDNSSRTQDKQP